MDARQRALAVIAILALVACAVAGLVAGKVGDGIRLANGHREIGLAGETARFPDAFRNQLLVWAPGGFSLREVGQVRDSTWVEAIAAVRAGQLGLAARNSAYPVIPLEVISADATAYGRAVGTQGSSLTGMLQAGMVLSQSTAKRHHLRPGAMARLGDGRLVRVSGVVDDVLLGGYEAMVDRPLGRQLHLDHVEYLLLRPRGRIDQFEAAMGRLLPGRPLRTRAYGEQAWFRPGDGALPLAQVKARFGEFSVVSLADPLPDRRWVAANIATRQVPVLGTVRCHKRVLGDLAAAMTELQRAHLESLVDVADFRARGGCFEPQAARAPGAQLSRHEWGIAINLDVAANPAGTAPRMDRRLVDVMARHGFIWAGTWLRPDGSYFEWAGSQA